jgi:pseudouridine kinase
MDAIDSLTPELIEQRFEALDRADLLALDANLPAPSIEALARRYGRGGVLALQGRKRPLLAYDPVSVAKAGRARSVLSCFDLIKPNRAEAALLAGFRGDPASGPGRQGLSALADSWRTASSSENSACYISLGAEGLFVEGQRERAGRFRAIVRAPEIPMINVSGAGDAAIAALAWSSLMGVPVAERAKLAVTAAALAAAADTTVNPALDPESLRRAAQGAQLEILS